MKTTSLNDLKKELQVLPSHELVELCVALAKYKKDNKEYLGYLLFESHDKSVFANEIRSEIDLHFTALKLQNNLYLIKKSLRKILRLVSKYCKYINDKAISADLYIYFCSKMKNSGIAIYKSQLLINMYAQQLKKINSLVDALHEDLKNDYARDIEKLTL
jgi:hypothetical protein